MPTQIEFVPFNKSAIYSLYADKDWVRWAFGCWCEDTGVIQVCTDTHLKAWEFFGKGNVDVWLAGKIGKNVVHELLHSFCPDCSEEQVEFAVGILFGGEKE